MYQGDDFNEVFNFSFKLEKKKVKVKDELIEKCKNMDPDFQRDYYTKTTRGIYTAGYDRIGVRKTLACSDRLFFRI